MSPIHQLHSRRRLLLKTSAIGFGQLALNAMLQDDARRRLNRSWRMPLIRWPRKCRTFAARAKRTIFLFMKGGPSHVDTFDPKPQLTRDHGNPPPFELPRVTFAAQGNLLKSPWKFHRYGESGLPVSELFPHVAQHVDDLCILRSVHGTNPAHGGALLKLHTGSDQFVRPSLGAWVTYGLGNGEPESSGICHDLSNAGAWWSQQLGIRISAGLLSGNSDRQRQHWSSELRQ